MIHHRCRVAVIFGGRSAEHEVSLQSARNVIEAIDRTKYEPVLIGIGRDGSWYLNQESSFLLDLSDPRLTRLNESDNRVAIVQDGGGNRLINPTTREAFGHIDVAFPVLHGPYGEDGSIQGLLKLANIPYVGADILGSAVGMDKDVMKRLLHERGIPTAKYVICRQSQIRQQSFEILKGEIGCPMFIKPANLGSSVGIQKAANKAEFSQAVENAFLYDSKILVEEYIKGREIECSVLGNQDPVASLPGEVIVKSDFYSYAAKYIDEHDAILQIPAELPAHVTERLQALAIEAFQALCCEGMARVDFFLRGDEIIVNELNTIPGFTKISMYPKLWQASGMSYQDLVSRLIELALERHQRDVSLHVTVSE